MDLNFTRKEKKLMKLAEDTLDRWRSILYIDPIWKIDLTIFDDEDNPNACARVDLSNAEYFFATIEISYGMLQLKEGVFYGKINNAISHELIHILLVDLIRSAQLSAGENEAMQKEIRYVYEKFTSRLQNVLIDFDDFFTGEIIGLENKLHNMEELQNKFSIIIDLLKSDKKDRYSKVEKILGIDKKKEIKK